MSRSVGCRRFFSVASFASILFAGLSLSGYSHKISDKPSLPPIGLCLDTNHVQSLQKKGDKFSEVFIQLVMSESTPTQSFLKKAVSLVIDGADDGKATSVEEVYFAFTVADIVMNNTSSKANAFEQLTYTVQKFKSAVPMDNIMATILGDRVAVMTDSKRMSDIDLRTQLEGLIASRPQTMNRKDMNGRNSYWVMLAHLLEWRPKLLNFDSESKFTAQFVSFFNLFHSPMKSLDNSESLRQASKLIFAYYRLTKTFNFPPSEHASARLAVSNLIKAVNNFEPSSIALAWSLLAIQEAHLSTGLYGFSLDQIITDNVESVKLQAQACTLLGHPIKDLEVKFRRDDYTNVESNCGLGNQKQTCSYTSLTTVDSTSSTVFPIPVDVTDGVFEFVTKSKKDDSSENVFKRSCCKGIRKGVVSNIQLRIIPSTSQSQPASEMEWTNDSPPHTSIDNMDTYASVAAIQSIVHLTDDYHTGDALNLSQFALLIQLDEAQHAVPASAYFPRQIPYNFTYLFNTQHLHLRLDDQRLLSISGRYNFDLLMGDVSVVNSSIMHLGKINITFPQELETQTIPLNTKSNGIILPTEADYNPRHTITHQIEIQESKPSDQIVIFFTVVTAVIPFLAFITALYYMGANARLITDGGFANLVANHKWQIGFQGLFVWMLTLILVYWWRLQLFTALRLICPSFFIMFLVGHRALCSIRQWRFLNSIGGEREKLHGE